MWEGMVCVRGWCMCELCVRDDVGGDGVGGDVCD